MANLSATLDGSNIALELLNLFVALKNKGGRGEALSQFMKSGGAKIIAQQMPHLFGIGFNENSLTTDILQKTEKAKPGSEMKLEKLTAAMTDYERYFFWMTITSIQLQKVATKQPKPADNAGTNNNQGSTEEIVYQPVSDIELDNRVQSLLFIVGMFERRGENAEETIRAMYSERIIEKNWLLRIWSYFSTLTKESILDPSGTTSIKEFIGSQGLLDTLKKHNDKLEQELGTSQTEMPDHPSILVWLIERMLFGSYKTPLAQTWEWTLIRKIFSRKYGRMSFRWPVSIEEKRQPMTHAERITPTLDGDSK